MSLISGMYDASPGNYWFGKKWFYTLTNPSPKCPEHLTHDKDGKPTGNKFINLIGGDGKVDEGIKIECIEY